MTTKVLAIDDSRTIRNLLRVSLEGAGFEFHSACDGQEGVEVFPDVDPDVVITDINMPKMDGFGVIDSLRSGPNRTTVPILVLTTESSDELKAREPDRVYRRAKSSEGKLWKRETLGTV
ncbi:response regulator, partial [Tropicibacter alexandrii]|uniref:response regulator n=1 Tax=Tropicibacter alexandrii TaxID=2267683 RepID=UPI001F0C5DA9